MEAVLSGVSAGVIGLDRNGPHHARQPLGAEAAGPRRGRARRPAAQRMPCPSSRPARRGAEPTHKAGRSSQVTLIIGGEERNFAVRVTHEEQGEGDVRLGADLRRRHRARRRPAHVGLGRRRAAHRARDQEPADADTTFGRAPAPQVRQGDHRGPRDVRALHRHDHAAGRRRQAHGRRVLRLRAHAQAADGGRTTSATSCAPAVLDPRRWPPATSHFELATAGKEPMIVVLRSPADRAGRHQPRQERRGGGRRRYARERRTRRPGLARPHRDGRAPQRRPRRHRGDRQRRRACPSRTARACSSPTSRPRATRAPASASPSCRRASSSTAARWRSRTRPPAPGRTHGALIRITLPAEPVARAGARRPPRACNRRRQRRRMIANELKERQMASDILIVDDEADIRELVAGILQDEGHRTRLARDCDEALEGHRGAPAAARHPRHLAAGQPARRPGGAQHHQAAPTPTCPSSSSPATATSRPPSPPSSAAPTTTSRSRSRPTGCCS